VLAHAYFRKRRRSKAQTDEAASRGFLELLMVQARGADE